MALSSTGVTSATLFRASGMASALTSTRTRSSNTRGSGSMARSTVGQGCVEGGRSRRMGWRQGWTGLRLDGGQQGSFQCAAISAGNVASLSCACRLAAERIGICGASAATAPRAGPTATRTNTSAPCAPSRHAAVCTCRPGQAVHAGRGLLRGRVRARGDRGAGHAALC